MCEQFARAIGELWLGCVNTNITFDEFIENNLTESELNIIPTEDIHECPIGMKILDICNVKKELTLNKTNNEIYEIVIQSLLLNDNILPLYYKKKATFLFLAQRYINIPHGYEKVGYTHASNDMSKKLEFSDINAFKIFLVVFFSKCIYVYYDELLQRHKQFNSMKNMLNTACTELVKKLCNIFLLDCNIFLLFLINKHPGATSSYYDNIQKEFIELNIKFDKDVWDTFVEHCKNNTM